MSLKPRSCAGSYSFSSPRSRKPLKEFARKGGSASYLRHLKFHLGKAIQPPIP